MSRKTRLLSALLILLTLFIVSICWANVYIWRDHDGILHLTNVKPDWWTDDMDQMDPDEIQEPEEPTPYPGCFVGDKENRKFHVPSCEQIYTPSGEMAIPDEKIIWFDSAEEALSKGYHPCDHCKPTESKHNCSSISKGQ